MKILQIVWWNTNTKFPFIQVKWVLLLTSLLRPNHLTAWQITRIDFKRGPGYLSRYSDSLRAGRSGDRIPVGGRGEKFSAPVQTGRGAHPVSYTMGTGSFPGVKMPGCGDDHPPSNSAEVKEIVELHLYSPSWPSWPVLGWTLLLLILGSRFNQTLV